MSAVISQAPSSAAGASTDDDTRSLRATMPVAPSGMGLRLIRFAFFNICRRPERFALSCLGIALAIMAVVLVRTISAGFADSGSTSLDVVLRGAPLWVVPAQGVRYDPALGALLPNGAPSTLTAPAGWQLEQVVGGRWHTPTGDVALYGRSDTPAGRALVGAKAAATLKLGEGDRLSVGGTSLIVTIDGPGNVVVADLAGATRVVGANGWWTVSPPAVLRNHLDLGTLLAAATGIPSSTDPSATPSATGEGLIYDTRGGTGALTFAQRYSAIFAGKVTGSTLGMVSIVGLILGFIIAVSSFLAAVQERRREFGIMSSIGLSDEVLYFFLVESGLVFVVSYLCGALLAGAAAAFVVPGMTTWSGWLTASGMVAAYLPAMAIVGALVPVHRLLQQRPVALLAEEA